MNALVVSVRDFALYGETTGETDEFGLPVRYNWAADYRGKAIVVYGHVPTSEPEWINNTICIDTGCVFGGRLTALRYPERELVSVAARRVYYEPLKPLTSAASETKLSSQHELDNILDIDDVAGKRIIETALLKNITIREENAALEVMSRFAANPKWLGCGNVLKCDFRFCWQSSTFCNNGTGLKLIKTACFICRWQSSVCDFTSTTGY